jgi:hypothetical protein
MLARRLALVVALVAALALVAILVTRDDGAIERSEEATDATAHAPTAPHVDLAAAAPEQARTVATAPLDAQVESVAEQPTGRIFAELVRPRAHDEDVELADATIVCTTAEGVQRRVRIGDEVLASDLAPGGLWVIAAPDHLPGVVDPEYVAALPLDSKWLPHDVDLRPRARLTLHFDDDPKVGTTNRSLKLMVPGWSDAIEAWILAESEGTSGRVAILALAEDLVRLADGVDARADAAQHVARIRATPLGAWGQSSDASSADKNPFIALLWLWNSVNAPVGASITLDHVLAGEDVAISASCDAPLVFTRADGAPLAAFPRRGVVETAAFELERGEHREYFVRQVPPATVRGRFPQTRASGAAPSLACEQPSFDGSRPRMAGKSCDPPARDDDGSFEWAGLAPGHYRFYTSWEEAGNVHRFVRHEFDLAAGEVRDLGELRPSADGRLTIRPRLVSEVALAAGVEPSDFTIELYVTGPMTAPRSSDTESAWESMRRFVVDFDEPCVVDGIERGTYHVALRSVRLKRSKRSRARPAGFDSESAALLAALSGGVDPSLYELTNPNRPIAVEVGEDTSVEVPAEVAAVGACTLRMVLPAPDPGRPYKTQAEFIRRDGLDAQKPKLVSTEIHSDGSATATAYTHLPPGEWLAMVAHDEQKDPHGLGVSLVGCVEVAITSGLHTEHTVQLEPAARLRVAIDFDPDTTPRLADLGDREHVGAVLRSSASGHVFDGLLPNTRYRFGERVIETGPPGSEVVLE